MLSRFSVKWKWYDWIFLAFAVIVFIAAMRLVAPTSGFSQSLHTGFHFLALLAGWIANGFIALAQLLNQL